MVAGRREVEEICIEEGSSKEVEEYTDKEFAEEVESEVEGYIAMEVYIVEEVEELEGVSRSFAKEEEWVEVELTVGAERSHFVFVSKDRRFSKSDLSVPV